MCPPQLWEEKKHHDGPVLNRRAVGSMGGMLLQILTARLVLLQGILCDGVETLVRHLCLQHHGQDTQEIRCFAA
jgi:hypothetical protein